MIAYNRIYFRVASILSRNIESRPQLLKFYKWFCFLFLKPKDLKHTPIFINNRNHLTYLSRLIEWFERNGYSNYYVIDNDSSYPPLLNYYEAKLGDRVIYLGRNVGHLSFWQEGFLKRVKNSFYVFTDSDVLPVLESNPSFLAGLYTALKKHNFALKAGSAIKIDDLPNHYKLRTEVIEHEKYFWTSRLDATTFRATVDTTLALYLPNYHWDSSRHWDKHIRVAGNCLIRHQPWYQDLDNLNEEQQYYRNNAATATHWTQYDAKLS